MRTQASKEGYLLIDHRASPGNADVPEGQVFESAVLTCSHCQTAVVLRPDRSRERHYCMGCDHYICDVCAEIRKNTGVCRTMRQVMAEVFERNLRAPQPTPAGPLILLTDQT